MTDICKYIYPSQTPSAIAASVQGKLPWIKWNPGREPENEVEDYFKVGRKKVTKQK